MVFSRPPVAVPKRLQTPIKIHIPIFEY